jgi:hypothetical protein
MADPLVHEVETNAVAFAKLLARDPDLCERRLGQFALLRAGGVTAYSDSYRDVIVQGLIRFADARLFGARGHYARQGADPGVGTSWQ